MPAPPDWLGGLFFGGGSDRPSEVDSATGGGIEEEEMRWEVGNAVGDSSLQSLSSPPPPEVETSAAVDDEFDGYALRDAILSKWGHCFDVEFQPVRTLGFRELYLNVMPFRLGSRRFRHDTELDYLCHLQAVVEILVRYGQLDYVLSQMAETTKKPRAGTSPLVAVPLRLDIKTEDLDDIMGL